MRDNILDQLILPKVSSAIADWSPSAAKRGAAPPLHTLVFPWLEHAGERMDMVLDEAKRKVRSWLKAWKARDGVPQGLDAWKTVRPLGPLRPLFLPLDRALTPPPSLQAFSKSDWDTLLLKHVLPQLGALLREQFVVNPRAQDLAPLEAVLAWRTLLRSSMLSQLLEAEFFPKWGDALYVWLTSEPNLEQVAEWCVSLSPSLAHRRLFLAQSSALTRSCVALQVLVVEVVLPRGGRGAVGRLARLPQGPRPHEPGYGARRRRQVPVRLLSLSFLLLDRPSSS